MKIISILLIGIALTITSCAQLQQSMQDQKDKSLKRDLELSHISEFTQRAGGGEKAVEEFHRINLLMLADKEVAFQAFSGDEEKRNCRNFASRFSNRAQQFLRSNWKDEALVTAFFMQIPQSYEQVNAFRGCGVETNELDFNQIYIPPVAGMLRSNPTLRKAKFRDGLLSHLAQVEALVEKVKPQYGDRLLRRITKARQEVQQFIGQ